MSTAAEYLVVLRNPQGSITWTDYQTKEQFDARKKELTTSKGYSIVREGVTEEEAIHLCRATPASAVMREAILECTDPVTGEIIPDLAEHAIEKAHFALHRQFP